MKLLLALHHPFELWRAPAWFRARLERDFPELEIAETPGYHDLHAAIKDADILLGWSLRPEQFAAAPRLRWIHSTAAAVHQLMSPELAASNVIITNSRAIHGPVVAEHALAVLLALAKRIPSAVRFQQQNMWAQEQIHRENPRELSGSTLLLIGLGSIGGEIAPRARALGMTVCALRRHPEQANKYVDRVFAPAELHAALAVADFVILAAPLTPATEHLINAPALAAMKPEAFLINVSRGPLIDDDALIAALRARRIAGAALDVFAEEPLPAGSPYWSLGNCLVTPHTAAVTGKLWERHYGFFTDNLRRFQRGEPLRGLVDKQRGY